MRIDLHVHSKHSKRPSEWILQKINCPESFAEPLRIYEIAKKRGMTHVTITDHNSIEGALEIAHLPDAFIGEEVTSYFPADGCKLHVLALNITEAHHEEIQKIRENVFDLAAYFHRENIFNIVAHPLYSVNDRLTADHFEQLLLLFQNFELNGARNDRENRILRAILNGLTLQHMERLSEKYGIHPFFPDPHNKRLFGGSDDHSSLNIARTYTEFSGIPDTNFRLSAMENHRALVHSNAPSPQTMAHNLYSIAWQYFRSKFNLQRYSSKDQLVNFLDRTLTLDSVSEPGMLSRVYFFLSAKKRKHVNYQISESLAALLRHETQTLIEENPDLLFVGDRDVRRAGEGEQRWFKFVNTLSSRIMVHFSDHLLDHLSGANVFNIFHTLGSAGGLTTLLAPYFVAFSEFTKGRDLGIEVAKRFGQSTHATGDVKPEENKVAHFTDTFYEVNGVALTLQQQVRHAVNQGFEYTLITCDDQNRPPQKGIKNFEPIGTYLLPEYEQQKIFYPPFLEILDYCHRQGFNHIYSATPGPIGLAALAVAKMLRLPISGTYHTSIPQYVKILTGSDFMEEIAWKFIIWYYDQMDLIYAPSHNTRNELISKGIKGDKIHIYPRGIDIERFHPRKRNGFFEKWKESEKTTRYLYVGRVSKEKNLHLLLQAFRKLVTITSAIQLVVIGEGPYLEEMKQASSDLPCIFTGHLEGDDLAAAYASSDIFVFPSATDTFGNVVLEAQASGLPVIVTDQGGPRENITPEITGAVVKADCSDSLFTAMEFLANHPVKRIAMGKAARRAMESRSFESAFRQTWEMFGRINAEKVTMAR